MTRLCQIWCKSVKKRLTLAGEKIEKKANETKRLTLAGEKIEKKQTNSSYSITPDFEKEFIFTKTVI